MHDCSIISYEIHIYVNHGPICIKLEDNQQRRIKGDQMHIHTKASKGLIQYQ